MRSIKTTWLSPTVLLGLFGGQAFNDQDSKYQQGLYWTIQLSQLNGFGRVNFQGNRFDYSASTIAVSSSVGYSLNPFHSVGLGAEEATPALTARIGNSFNSDDAIEIVVRA